MTSLGMYMKKLIILFCFIATAFSMFAQNNALEMVKIPDMKIKMLATEVTENLYKYVMGEIPYNNLPVVEGEDKDSRPVTYIGFCDAIYFCNKLSEMSGLKPVYSFNGKTDVNTWNYTPHKANFLDGKLCVKKNANGYRLPTIEEWQYAANSGESYVYSGSNEIDEVAWNKNNSENTVHQVRLKKANQYGLYDMTGNVSEWCWDWPMYKDFYTYMESEFMPTLGGSFKSNDTTCMNNKVKKSLLNFSSNQVGFRIVCLDKE